MAALRGDISFRYLKQFILVLLLFLYKILFIFTELISCSRHLTVKSSIVSVEESSPPLIIVSTEECDDVDEEEGSDDSCDEEDCEECKIKQKGALVDSLPPIVVEGMYIVS
jgi:hypothetical protein